MLPKIKLSDLTIAVATSTLIRLLSVAGGPLLPGLDCQHALSSVFTVAFASHCAVPAAPSVSANPLKDGLPPHCPPVTWLAHCAPQKFTCWPTFSPPLLPPQITNEVD